MTKSEQILQQDIIVISAKMRRDNHRIDSCIAEANRIMWESLQETPTQQPAA